MSPQIGMIVHYQAEEKGRPYAAIISDAVPGNSIVSLYVIPKDNYPRDLVYIGVPYSEMPKFGFWSYPSKEV